MALSLAERLRDAVNTLKLIDLVVRGPSEGVDSIVALAPGVEVRTLSRRLLELTFLVSNASGSGGYSIISGPTGPGWQLKGLKQSGLINLTDDGKDISVGLDTEQVRSFVEDAVGDVDQIDGGTF